MMLQLESKGQMLARKLATERPDLFSHPQPVFEWEMFPLNEADVDWDDRSYHKTLTCRNHPKSRYTTKNPWDRSLFGLKGQNGGDLIFDTECNCPFSDLRVVIR